MSVCARIISQALCDVKKRFGRPPRDTPPTPSVAWAMSLPQDLSRSSGLPVAFGHLMDGRLVIVVYRWVDQVTVQPITAYEVPE